MRHLWLFVCLTAVRGQTAIRRDNLPTFCVGGKEEFFQCGEADRCINRRAICDGHQDCSNNADEINCQCRRNKDCPRGTKCRKDLEAATSACVNCLPGQHFVKSQCEDINECKNQTADVCAGRGSCVNRLNGFECVTCPQGYEASLRDARLFAADPAYNRSETFRKLLLCTDHDECIEENPCGDGGTCFNRNGGYSCQCPPHHEKRSDIRDNICQAVGEQPLIAVGNNTSILIFELRSAVQIQQLRWGERIVDLTADSGMVIFATRRQIVEYRIATESTLLLADLDSDENFSHGDIRKISADWENHRVYVLTGDSVSVVDVVGRTVKIIEHRGNISSIAVDPKAGYLFYSEFGSVRRSHLDGSAESAKTVFTALPVDDRENIEVLALDPNLDYVYYIHNRVLYSFDYDGHRALIITGSADYTRLEPFEDLLYATYRVVVSDTIVTLGRTGYSVGLPPDSRVESFKGTRPKSFAIVQRAKFPVRPKALNSCLSKPCSTDWCFPTPASREPSYRCDCGASEQRGNCLALTTYRLRPVTNDVLPNEEKISVPDASVPITAHISKVGIIIPIALVFFNCFNLL